jgi:hypothetical protein
MKVNMGKIITLGAVALAGLGLSSNAALAANIYNDAWKTSTNGNTCYAQEGHISKFGSTYYWYGEKWNGAVTYHDTGTVNSDTSFVCVNCYTSTDLINWTPGVSVLKPGGNILTSDYLGRVAGVLYNSSTGKYVMWVRYVGAQGSGELLCTASSPTGPFTWVKLQTAITNVYDSVAGDASIFVDTAHGGAPYFICSDAHGRQHAYVAPLSSDYQTINSATLIGTWGQGQEADAMVYSTASGYYYFTTSETNGYSYSHGYQVHSKSLLSGYSADADFSGTDATNSYYAQVEQWVPIVGSSGTVYMLMCDRFCDLNSNYKNAGHGTGYNPWQPCTLTSSTPTFPALGSWTLNAAAGTWTN